MRMKALISELSPLRMAPNSAGLDACVEILKQQLPFTVHEFAGGLECNGWIVPMKWEIVEAKIRNSAGTVIYDGMHHPLAVIGYSQSFTGRVSKDELKQHLFFKANFDDALVYHCDLFYKPFVKNWGFSVTKNFYNNLPDGDYDIELRTSFEEGTMKVAEYVLPGEHKESIVINAHNCHAFCCNDDLAGVVVGVEVMRELAKLPKRKFTYRLIIAPEHFGSIFYLDSLSDEEAKHLKWATFLEMVGTQGPLALQRSFNGNSFIDRAYKNALTHSGLEWWTAPFRQIVGNDETCWDSAGYGISCPSLSRSDGKTHFPEYHSSHDSPELIDEARLEETLKIVLETFFIMENDATMEKKFKGLVALSHPRYDLYKDFWDPAIEGRREISDLETRWNYLMNCIPMYFDGQTRILEIAEKHQLPFRTVYQYVKDFEAKGLISISPTIHEMEERELPPR